jgi:hypothetical protein
LAKVRGSDVHPVLVPGNTLKGWRHSCPPGPAATWAWRTGTGSSAGSGRRVTAWAGVGGGSGGASAAAGAEVDGDTGRGCTHWDGGCTCGNAGAHKAEVLEAEMARLLHCPLTTRHLPLRGPLFRPKESPSAAWEIASVASLLRNDDFAAAVAEMLERLDLQFTDDVLADLRQVVRGV